jgi:hypothetical protein
MILKVYTVYDSKAEAFLQPFFSQSKGVAIRSFQEAVRDEKSNISKYPEDFTLFELGEYDDANSKFNLHNTPQSLGVAVEFLTPKG